MAYEYVNKSVGTAATVTVTGNVSSGLASAVRETTQLEHLNELRKLHDEIGSAANRAMRLADRLLGQEPATISKSEPNAKDAVEPPLLSRLEHACMRAAEMAASMHYHLNRLERL